MEREGKAQIPSPSGASPTMQTHCSVSQERKRTAGKYSCVVSSFPIRVSEERQSGFSLL